jgi:hypothetical protein
MLDSSLGADIVAAHSAMKLEASSYILLFSASPLLADDHTGFLVLIVYQEMPSCHACYVMAGQ